MITQNHPRSLHSEAALVLLEEKVGEYARERRNDHIGTEHLLLGLKDAGGDAISTHVLSETPRLQVIDDQILRYLGEGNTIPDYPIQFTDELIRVYYRAIELTAQMGLGYVGTDTLLLALLVEPCDGRQILELCSCSVEDLAIRTRYYIGLQDREPPAKEISFSGA